jgi:hypothetical protein
LFFFTTLSDEPTRARRSAARNSWIGCFGGNRLQGQEQKQRSSGAKSMKTKQSWSGKDATWERAQMGEY